MELKDRDVCALLTYLQFGFGHCKPSFLIAYSKRKIKDVNCVADSLGVTLSSLAVTTNRLIRSGDIIVDKPFQGFGRNNVEFEYRMNKNSKTCQKYLAR